MARMYFGFYAPGWNDEVFVPVDYIAFEKKKKNGKSSMFPFPATVILTSVQIIIIFSRAGLKVLRHALKNLTKTAMK